MINETLAVKLGSVWVAPEIKVTKTATSLPISNELLADRVDFTYRSISDFEWNVYIARLVLRRCMLQHTKASVVQKSALTRQIKRLLKQGNPRMQMVAR